MSKKMCVILMAVGVLLMLLLGLFWGGFGFWEMPGLFLVFLGIGGLVMARIPGGKMYKGGIVLFAIGLSILLGTLPHLMMGAWRLVSYLIILIGIVLILVGKAARRG